METTLNNIRTIIVNTVQKSKNELVDILNKTGIPTSYHDTKTKVQGNVVKALSISNKFADRLKELILNNHVSEVKNAMGSEVKTLGFASQPLYQRTLGLDDIEYAPVIDPHFLDAISFQKTGNENSNIAMDGSYCANGSFGSDETIHSTANPFGSDFSFRADGTPSQPNVVDKVVGWLNKALNIYSDVVKQSPAAETDKLAQLQAQLDAEKAKSKKSWIVPTILATIVTATVVILVIKKKK
jgi:hypothetical protein